MLPVLPPYIIYAVLGFLNEYIGRTVVKESELVEHFWNNESQIADIFEQYLLSLIDDRNLQTSLRREVKDGQTYFFSTELTQLIDSYYLTHRLTGTDADRNPAYTSGQGVFQQNTGKISTAIFPSSDREAKFAYLIGTYQRYGKHNMFQFANAHHKAQLVQQLLQEVGSPQVVFIYSDPDSVPSIFRVAFEPTIELIERLNLQLSGY
jgi:hypothetical protein